MKPLLMRRSIRLGLPALAALILAAPARADEAADTATARALGIEGVTLAEGGKCKEAIEKLDRAEKLHHAPTTATRLGECEIETGKLVLGTERLQRVIREPLPANAHPAFVAAVARAQKALDSALPRLAALKISVNGPPAAKLAIMIDGEPTSEATLDTHRRIDPGTHEIKVSAPGFLPSALSTSLAEGETRSVVLELKPDPHVPPPPRSAAPGVSSGHVAEKSGSKVPALFAFGVAAAGLGVGIYGATVVEDRLSQLSGRCDPNRVCPNDLKPVFQDAKTWATVSTAGFITAGAGVATGVLLLLLAGGSSASDPAKSGARVRPAIGATSLGVDGVF
ncbi:MAG TPA: hypothetical protein VM925_35230 [Labilithrix sp.]|nr:hypothetical protein [Labilithrix sp.]